MKKSFFVITIILTFITFFACSNLANSSFDDGIRSFKETSKEFGAVLNQSITFYEDNKFVYKENLNGTDGIISGTYSGNVLEDGTITLSPNSKKGSFFIDIGVPSSGTAVIDGNKCTVTFVNGSGGYVKTTING